MPSLLEDVLKKIQTMAVIPKRKKIFFAAATIVFLVLAGCYVWGGWSKTAGSYVTDTVKRGAVTSTIPATGMLEPVSTVSLSFKNAEIIKKIHVKVGDHVSAGQLLAEQEGDNLEAQRIQSAANLKGAVSKLELLRNGAAEEDIAQAEASVKMAQAAYDLALTDLERCQKLFQEGAVSQADLDTKHNSYTSAEGKLKQARESLKSLQAGNRPEDIAAAAAQVESSTAQLKIAEKDLEGAKMVSPMDGIVSAVNGGEGQRATANNNATSSGSGFIEVIAEDLQVKAQVNEADIGRLALGQKAEFTVNSFPDQTFTGQVSSIAPRATTVSNVQLYDIVIQLDGDRQNLKAGMPADVSIIVARHENTLTIPKGAVTFATSYLAGLGQSMKTSMTSSQNNTSADRQAGARTGSASQAAGSDAGSGMSGAVAGTSGGKQATVLVMDKSGNPVARRVVLGLSDLRYYEIVAGLNEGETVVVGSLSQNAGNTGGTASGGPVPGVGVRIAR